MKILKHATVVSTIASLLMATVVMAQDTNTAPTATTGVDLVCMQTAVEKRDNAVITAKGAFDLAVTAALTARRDALKAAWGNADRAARRAAIKAAWTTFKKAARDASSKFKRDKKAAWNQFRKDAKTCKGTTEGEVEGADLAL